METNKDRLKKLLDCFELVFVDAKNAVLKNGWYLWRNSTNWPIEEYKFVQICNNEMTDEEPEDSWGLKWLSVQVKPYGQLAGPILEI